MLKLTDIDMNTDLIISVSLVYTCIQLNIHTILYRILVTKSLKRSHHLHVGVIQVTTCTSHVHVYSPELPLPILV